MRASNKIYKTPAVSPTEYGSFYELDEAPQSRKQKPNYKLAKINTPNTTINVVEGAGPDSFEIATKDYKATEGAEGSTIIGFVKNKDFPGEVIAVLLPLNSSSRW